MENSSRDVKKLRSIRHVAPAMTLRLSNAGWQLPYVGAHGVKTISPATFYKLVDLLCANEHLLKKNAQARLDDMRFKPIIQVNAIHAYAFSDVTLLPHGVMLVGDQIVDETLTPIPDNDYYTSPIINYLENINSGDHLESVVAADTPVLIIDQPGIFNYGHWVVEIFPKLAVLLEQLRDGSVKVALPCQYREWGFINAMLFFLDIDPANTIWYELRPIDEGTYLTFSKVIFVSPISKHPFPGYISPWSINTLANLTNGIVANKSSKIFVSREDAPNRFLSNEAEVYKFLQSLGYELVQTALMSFEEQVRVFREASHIVGVFGASMTNICFCKNQAKIMMIAPNYHLDHFYWDLVSLKNIQYEYFVGSPTIGSENGPFQDFSIDLDSFKHFFKAFDSENAAFRSKCTKGRGMLCDEEATASLRLP